MYGSVTKTVTLLVGVFASASLSAQEQAVETLKENSAGEMQTETLTRQEEKILKTITNQLRSRRLIKTAKNEYRRSSDSFVVAKIHVELQGQVAEVCFEAVSGIDEAGKLLFDYLKETPSGALRDYRIVSRYRVSDDAEKNLALVRQQYDALKEQEAQMIAYLQARNQAFARVNRTRRC